MFPHLLYVGDVPVEASYHGSAVLHRLLANYPADRLTVIETAAPSAPSRRLPSVNYRSQPLAKQRWLNTRFHPQAVARFSRAATRRGPQISSLLNGFGCESVLTVAHGFGWLAAADLAAKRNVPLHLMVHDDWPRVANVKPGFREWIDEKFASIYRQARSRICVSPAMRAAYQARYGVEAEVLYPMRAVSCAEFEAPPERLGRSDGPFTIAFAGSINSDGYIQALVSLQRALETVGGRLLIFGPLTPEAAQQVGLDSPRTTVRGLLNASELMTRLREEADALFVPMSFDPVDRTNMELAFPSKLADCTAIGLPLLIYGPPYCSAVAWARENTCVGEVVAADEGTDLGQALERLASDPMWRVKLGKRALEVGRQYFAYEAGQQVFNRALSLS
ncbi:MAG TPA: glycosyltransferase [Pyrinomonadaceae bacterium]|jgi:glycosyltransferase involved in cell wall biosynthesis